MWSRVWGSGCLRFARGMTARSSNSAASGERKSGDGVLASVPGLAVPMLLQAASRGVAVERAVRPFDEIPGPRLMKYLAAGREYLTAFGTQLTARVLTFGFNMGAGRTWNTSYRNLTYLFNEYGPVVRFVSPLGGDIVLLNNPEHIQKVYAQEGQYPVRSTLDSLEKYRVKCRNHQFIGPFSVHGEDWVHQRSLIENPFQTAVSKYAEQIYTSCDGLTHKIYRLRNNQDELPHDVYSELHKWAFDCMGYIVFSKNMAMLEAEVINSQSDSTWLYNGLVNATNALMKCESGLQMWKLFDTPAWLSLVDNCDSLESLIGKQVRYVEQEMILAKNDLSDASKSSSLISAILMGENMRAEDAVTILMDMLLIGVNTTTSAMGFLLYNLARSQKSQKQLHKEVQGALPNINYKDFNSVKQNTPYLQACIKETLRLIPPIPILTRILPKNIVLDKFNVPRGTLIIMSTKDSSLKESNFEDASKFYPERWLRSDAKDYHAFASIPFGFGARRCLGQGVAEACLSMLAIKLIQKYKLEYHYGDVSPTATFIARPNKPLKIRFIDRD